MSKVERFQQYADAFEVAFEKDDWSAVEPFFTENAVYEIIADEPLGGLHEGRRAVLDYFKQALDGFDRRFDSRELEPTEGPIEKDGAVWMRWRVTYRVGDAPPLSMEGEETATFEGDRISRLEDRFQPNAGKEAALWMGEHGSKLGAS